MTPLTITPSTLALLYMAAAFVMAITVGAAIDRMFTHRIFQAKTPACIRVSHRQPDSNNRAVASPRYCPLTHNRFT